MGGRSGEGKKKENTDMRNNAFEFVREQSNVNTASGEALYVTITMTLITKHLYCGRTPNYIYSEEKRMAFKWHDATH